MQAYFFLFQITRSSNNEICPLNPLPGPFSGFTEPLAEFSQEFNSVKRCWQVCTLTDYIIVINDHKWTGHKLTFNYFLIFRQNMIHAQALVARTYHPPPFFF